MPADLPPKNVAEIASYGRDTMWVDGRTVRLYSAGRTTDLAIKPFKQLDLGPDARGRTVAVYVRGSTIYRYDVAAKRETKLFPGGMPTIWGRRLAYTRGDFIVLRDGTRTTRVADAPNPDDVELGPKHLAYTSFTNSNEGNGEWAVFVHGIASRRNTVVDSGVVGEGDSTGFSGLTFTTRGLFWKRAHRSACTVRLNAFKAFNPRAGRPRTVDASAAPLAVRDAPLLAPDTPESEGCSDAG